MSQTGNLQRPKKERIPDEVRREMARAESASAAKEKRQRRLNTALGGSLILGASGVVGSVLGEGTKFGKAGGAMVGVGIPLIATGSYVLYSVRGKNLGLGAFALGPMAILPILTGTILIGSAFIKSRRL